jgi:transcriptional regulator with XRE-family HTH domain
MKLDIFLAAKERQGLTYDQIGKYLGMARPTVYTILNGTRPASLKKLLMLAKVLGVSEKDTKETYAALALERAEKRMTT